MLLLSYLPVSIGEEALGGLQAKIILDTCSGSLLAFLEGAWLSCETSTSHCNFLTQLFPSLFLMLFLGQLKSALQSRAATQNNAFSAR